MSLCSYCQLDIHQLKPKAQNTDLQQRMLSTMCEACRLMMPLNQRACCYCAEPITQPQKVQAHHANQGETCKACKIKPPLWQYIVSPLVYTYPVKESIHQFKFKRKLLYGRALIQVFFEHLVSHYAHRPFPNVLIPVPQHKKRSFRRGFNPTLWLAQQICKPLRLPLNTHLVLKDTDTSPQVTLSLQDRKTNLKDSFKLRSDLSKRNSSSSLKHTHIAIFDDVMTTGSTINEIIRTIAPLSPASIHVWCIARTPASFKNGDEYNY